MKTNAKNSGSSLHRFALVSLLVACFAFSSLEASAFTFIFSTTPAHQQTPPPPPPPAPVQGYKPGVVHNQKPVKKNHNSRTLFGPNDNFGQPRTPVTNKPQQTPPGAPGLPRK